MQVVGADNVVGVVPSASWHRPSWMEAACPSPSCSLPTRGPSKPLKGESIEREGRENYSVIANVHRQGRYSELPLAFLEAYSVFPPVELDLMQRWPNLLNVCFFVHNLSGILQVPPLH